MRRPIGLVQVLRQLPQHRRIAIDSTDRHPVRVGQRWQAVIGAKDIAGAVDQIEMILLGNGGRGSRGEARGLVIRWALVTAFAVLVSYVQTLAPHSNSIGPGGVEV